MKKRASVFLKTAICIVSVLILAAAVYFGTYYAAVRCAQTGCIDTAEKLVLLPQLTALHDPYLADYINAARYAGDDEFDKAVKLYYELSENDYRDSHDRMVDAQYQQAMAVLDEGDFRLAQLLFAEADRLGHKDAEDMVDETTLLWAEDLMEQGDLVAAYQKLNEIRRYSYAEDLRNELTAQLYDEAVSLYRASNHSAARQRFELIPAYKDANKYLLLTYAHAGTASGYVDVSRLRDMFFFEDTAQVLLKTSPLAFEYLEGTWLSADSIRCMQIFEDSYYLEGFPETNRCWIIDGIWYSSDLGYFNNFTMEKAPNSAIEAVFKLRLVAPDILEVYCIENDTTYMLYRQMPWQIIDDTRI